MSLILNMSMSANGIAARDNDSTDFLSHGEYRLLAELARQAGALIWGRRTHELVRNYGGLGSFDGIPGVVITHNADFSVEDGWRIATSPEQALEVAGASGASEAVLAGGRTTNTSFARAGLIDEVVLFVGSVIVGSTISLFTPEMFDLPLHLVDATQVADEVVRLRYQVQR